VTGRQKGGMVELSYANTVWHVGSSFSADCDASVRLAYSNKCSLYVS